MKYHITARGPDILLNVIFSGFITIYQINTFFVNRLYYFFTIDKMASRAGLSGLAGRIWSAGRSLETPVLDVYSFCFLSDAGKSCQVK